MAKVIIWATDLIAAQLQKLSDLFGGLEKTIEAIGIMSVIAFGPRLLMMLQAAVIETTRWIARNFIIIAQYAAMAAAVFAVFLAIQDIMVWMRGGDSVIGDWLGPFDKFKEDAKKAFDLSDFFAPFKAFQEFIEGDFTGAWEKLKQSLRDVNGLLGWMLFLIPAVWLGFRLWNTLKFFGLIAALKGVVEVIALISSGAIEAVAQMIRLARAGVLMRAGPIGMAALLAMEGWDALRGRNKGDIVRPLDETEKQAPPKTGSGSWLRDKIFGPSTTAPAPTTSPNGSWLDNLMPKSDQSIKDWIQGRHKNVIPQVSPGQITPGYSPGGGIVAPGGTQNNNNTVNQNNSVTIQLDPGLSLTEQITNGISSVWDTFARQARNAMPVTESPTQ
jgi:hypothetical protein